MLGILPAKERVPGVKKDDILRICLEKERKKITLDIRKVLEQLGIEREKWPEEWFGKSPMKP